MSGCTVDRIKSTTGTTFEAFDLRSGISVSRQQSFRLSPTTPVFLQHRRHSNAASLDVAHAGLSRVFYRVSPADPDVWPAMGLLMVVEPPTPAVRPASALRVRLLPIEHLLPQSAASTHYRIHLLDLAANQVVDVIELKVDPALYRRESEQRALITNGFEQFGRALIAPSDA